MLYGSNPRVALLAIIAVSVLGSPALAQPKGNARIVVDGDLSEWPADVAAVADADFVYLRTSLDGPERTLQAMQDRTLELWIDADSRPDTGVVEPSPRAAAGMGVDLEVRFSPLTGGGIGTGVDASVPTAGGDRIALGHADAGVMFLPTYAALEYEIRISRHSAEVPGGLAGGVLAGQGRATFMLVMRDATGKVKGWSDPFSAELPAVSGARPRTVLPVPAKGDREVRVMTWNVLKSAPMRNPGPFARTIASLDPDIILFQEWAEGGEAAIEGWLNDNIGLADGGGWKVLRSEDGDVAIASRSSLSPVGDNGLRLDRGEGARPVRFVAALASSDLGPILVATAHLKCCGYTGSDEDVRRLAEAEAINRALKSAVGGAAGASPLRIVGGDLNLVGSRPPLDALCAGLDADGTDLDVVDATVWGDRALYTWSDASNGFSPGRLDYLIVGESAARVVRSFVLDPSTLSDSALLRMGLRPEDIGVSDHLPVVVDIKAR